MSQRSLLIDGMLSGTGIRDAAEGGYLDPAEIGLSKALQQRLSAWLTRYEDAHFHQFDDSRRNEALDQEGIEIAKIVRSELPDAQVGYFSNAHMCKIEC